MTAKILTHSGRFHADDVIACELLSLIEDGNVEIFRTREYFITSDYKWVVDIGHTYDPTRGLFDHHQKDCNETWPGCNILLSSSGMVFLNMWDKILEKLGHPNPTWEEADMIYKQVFLPIDAHDNGQLVEDHNYKFMLKFDYGCKNYGNGIQVGRVIADMNHDNVNSEEQNARFSDAMKYVFDSFVPVISTMMKNMRSNQAHIKHLKNIDVSSGVIVLPAGCYLNKYILKEIDPCNKLLFTVYEKKRDEWGFSAIQSFDNRFVNRADLVEPDFQKYPDLIFIHKNLFCGSCKTKEEAINVCNDSVKQYKNNLMRKKIIGSIIVAIGLSGLYLYKN